MRKLIAAAVLILAVAGGAYLYHIATTPFRALPTVEVNAAQAAAAQRKVDALRSLGGGGSTGQPARASETFSDSELSSLANQELQSESLPLDNLVLHATADGRIEGLGTAHWSGQILPLYLLATVQVVDGDQLQLTIVESKLGQLNVPASLAGQIDSAAMRSVNLGQALQMDDITIAVSQAAVTVSGIARTG